MLLCDIFPGDAAKWRIEVSVLTNFAKCFRWEKSADLKIWLTLIGGAINCIGLR